MNFFKELWVQIAGGILVVVILTLWAILRRKARKMLFDDFYLPLEKKADKCLKELRESRKEHIVSKYLMYFIAKQSGIHLFNPEGEDVSLSEYAEILNRSIESLTEILKRIYLVELTLPSDWYHKEEESKERADIIGIARRYFENQKALKKAKGDDVTIKRYIVVPQQEFKTDPKRDDFIKEHDENDIELYLCPSKRIRKNIIETSIFFDAREKGWVIRSLDFNIQSLQNPTNWVRVQIEDRQEQVNNFYQTLITELEMHAIKLAPK